MRAKVGRMIMCHMLADTSVELLAMVRTIGVDPKRIRCEGTHREHFDVCRSKRALAVKAGAKELDYVGLCVFLNRKRIESEARNGSTST